MRFKALLCVSILLALSGCYTVTATQNGSMKKVTEPDFEKREHFFLWGLAPNARVVNVKKACPSNAPTQMQTQNTFLDSFLGVITLGIYSPRTAKVWCS